MKQPFIGVFEDFFGMLLRADGLRPLLVELLGYLDDCLVGWWELLRGTIICLSLIEIFFRLIDLTWWSLQDSWLDRGRMARLFAGFLSFMTPLLFLICLDWPFWDHWLHLNVQNSLDNCIALLLLIRDAGILVHAKDLWLVNFGQQIDILMDFLNILIRFGYFVKFIIKEWKFCIYLFLLSLILLLCGWILLGKATWIEYLLAVAFLQETDQQDSIIIVGHTSSIVDVASHELHRVPWDLLRLK